jgi:thioredoxin reductase (NADPH)
VNLNEERLSETPDVAGAYPRLSDEQIELLSRRGEKRPVRRGDVLIVEGQRDRAFLVVLSGKAAVIEEYGTPKARLVGVHGPSPMAGYSPRSTTIGSGRAHALMAPADRT